MQSAHLRVLFEHAERDEANFHLALSGVLRSMLCDAHCATLIVLAREKGVDLRVWSPMPPEAASHEPPTMMFSALVASAVPVPFSYEMPLDAFMDAPIGVATTLNSMTGERSTEWYTPRKLIKWAANKEGPAHFDAKPSASFEAIGSSMLATGEVVIAGPDVVIPLSQTDQLEVRNALLQIAQTAIALSALVLEVREGEAP